MSSDSCYCCSRTANSSFASASSCKSRGSRSQTHIRGTPMTLKVPCPPVRRRFPTQSADYVRNQRLLPRRHGHRELSPSRNGTWCVWRLRGSPDHSYPALRWWARPCTPAEHHTSWCIVILPTPVPWSLGEYRRSHLGGFSWQLASNAYLSQVAQDPVAEDDSWKSDVWPRIPPAHKKLI